MVVLKRKELEEFMKLKGLNYSKLAKQLGYSRSTVSKIVNGKLLPSTRFIARLKRISNVPVEYFFNFDVHDKQLLSDSCFGNNSSTNKKEGTKCGQEDEGRKLDRGRTARTTGEALSTQNTDSKVCFQALEERAVGNQQTVSGKQAGNNPAVV